MSRLPEPVLLLGASGLLGAALSVELRRRGVRFAAPSRSELDLRLTGPIGPAIASLAPGAVIHAAGATDVARAETPTGREEASRLNRDAPRALALACGRTGIPLVHLSTDYVFDGEKGAPYLETDSPRPVQEFGRTKLEGEEAVLEAHPGSLVVRTSTLFGPGPHRRPSFVDTVLRQARQMPVVTVSPLPRSSPTYTVDLAAALLDLLAADGRGIVHAVNSGEADRSDLARATVELRGLGRLVEVRAEADPAGGPRRPRFTALAAPRLEAALARPMRPWQDALAAYLEDLRP